MNLIYSYIVCTSQKGRVNRSEFHRKFSPYNRKQTTFHILNTYKNLVYTGPFLVVACKVYGEFLFYHNFPAFESYEERKKNKLVNHSILCCGTHSLISFIQGSPPDSTDGKFTGKLVFFESILPNYPSKFSIEDIDPSVRKKQIIPMSYPHHWDELDWRIYKYMKDPNNSSFAVSKKLKVDYKTVLRRLAKIMKDCKIWISFFPKGIKGYHQFFIALRTDFEAGLKEELARLDRTSYFYKIGDVILLHLFLDEEKDALKFQKMEEEGLISLVGISTPLKYHNEFSDF